EIRNPLTGIKMLVEAAARGRNSRPLTAEGLAVVRSEVARLEHIVQGFLDFTRPPALERRDCDLRDVVADAAALVQTRARQQQVQLRTELGERAVMAHVDRGQMCPVLVNLFLNALDAMPDGGQLDVCVRSGSCGEVALAVSDTGAGIEAA